MLILCVVRAFTVRETTYYESDAAFLKRILGGRKGRNPAILVMNDEAHHSCRRGTESRSRKMLSRRNRRWRGSCDSKQRLGLRS